MFAFFKYFTAFLLGIFIAGITAYNLLYGSLIYTQLHSSILFYERLDSHNREALKQSLTQVLIPMEVCRAHELANSLLFIEQEQLNSEIEKAFSVIASKNTDRDSFCQERKS